MRYNLPQGIDLHLMSANGKFQMAVIWWDWKLAPKTSLQRNGPLQCNSKTFIQSTFKIGPKVSLQMQFWTKCLFDLHTEKTVLRDQLLSELSFSCLLPVVGSICAITETNRPETQIATLKNRKTKGKCPETKLLKMRPRWRQVSDYLIFSCVALQRNNHSFIYAPF